MQPKNSRPRERAVDPSVVERAQRGDRDAFATLAFLLSDRLFGVAQRILGDYDSAGDALQTALVRIWRDLPGLRDPARIEGWAYRVLVRACNDQLRRERRRAGAIGFFPLPLIVHGPEVEVADRDQLDRAFRRLSTDQRAAVVLQHYLGMSLSEIAEIQRVPVGTVRSRLHYARRVMRGALESDARQTIPRGQPQ
jgi:RNA polymerase sigma-70 factor (ECF subfamily)